MFRLFIPVLISVACFTPCFGQGALATLTGTVTDPSGASVGDVTVQARQVETGTVLTAVKSDTGNYILAWTYYASMIVFLGSEFTRAWAQRHHVAPTPEANAMRVKQRDIRIA